MEWSVYQRLPSRPGERVRVAVVVADDHAGALAQARRWPHVSAVEPVEPSPATVEADTPAPRAPSRRPRPRPDQRGFERVCLNLPCPEGAPKLAARQFRADMRALGHPSAAAGFRALWAAARAQLGLPPYDPSPEPSGE